MRRTSEGSTGARSCTATEIPHIAKKSITRLPRSRAAARFNRDHSCKISTPMSYALFVALVALSYLRPFELYAPETAEIRPMLLLTLAALVAAIATPSCRKQAADKATPLTFALLFWLTVMVSWLANGFLGGAIGVGI